MEGLIQTSSTRASHWTARSMVGRAFLAQNVGIGCAFGGFSIAVLSIQEKYNAGAGATGLALALCVLVMGVSSPLAGAMIGRIGLRWTMLIGLLISGLGYVGLAFAPSMAVVLALYAIPVGVGLAMIGPIPASVLASNWYAADPGVALGIANMPLMTALIPLAGVALIRDFSLQGFFLTLVGLHVLLLPFIIGVRDGPNTLNSDSHLPQNVNSHDNPVNVMVPVRTVLSSTRFWLICLGSGFLNAVSIAGISVFVPLAAEHGVSSDDSATLLVIIGGASVVGSLVVGMLSSRFGAARSLAACAAVLGLSWAIMLGSTTFTILAVAGLLQGVCSAGVFPAVNILSSRMFGQESLPRVIGLSGMLTLPITFCVPPLAGVLHDAAHSYGPVITFFVGGCAIVTIIFGLLGLKAETSAQLATA